MDIKKSSQSIVTKNISLKKSFCILLLLLSKYKEINLLSRYIIKQNSSRQKNSRNLVKKKKNSWYSHIKTWLWIQNTRKRFRISHAYMNWIGKGDGIWIELSWDKAFRFPTPNSSPIHITPRKEKQIPNINDKTNKIQYPLHEVFTILGWETR